MLPFGVITSIEKRYKSSIYSVFYSVRPDFVEPEGFVNPLHCSDIQYFINGLFSYSPKHSPFFEYRLSANLIYTNIRNSLISLLVFVFIVVSSKAATAPPDEKSELVIFFLNSIPVLPNTTYYWKVVTKDIIGNTSDKTTK